MRELRYFCVRKLSIAVASIIKVIVDECKVSLEPQLCVCFLNHSKGKLAMHNNELQIGAHRRKRIVHLAVSMKSPQHQHASPHAHCLHANPSFVPIILPTTRV